MKIFIKYKTINILILSFLMLNCAVINNDIHELNNQCESGKDRSCKKLKKIGEKFKDLIIDKKYSEFLSCDGREYIIPYIRSPFVLFRIIQNDSDPDVQISVFNTLDTIYLIDEGKTKKEFLELITNQDVLAYIAKNNDDSSVRIVATEKITDQSALIDIAKNDDDSSVRKVATEKITDQSALIDLAKNDDDLSVRIVATEKITDPAVLAYVAKNDEFYLVRKVAIKKITDPAVLAYIAKNDDEKEIRSFAVSNIIDQKALIDIAKNNDDSSVRIVATEKIMDQSVLIDIVKNDESWSVRQRAKSRLLEFLDLSDYRVYPQIYSYMIKYSLDEFKNIISMSDPFIEAFFSSFVGATIVLKDSLGVDECKSYVSYFEGKPIIEYNVKCSNNKLIYLFKDNFRYGPHYTLFSDEYSVFDSQNHVEYNRESIMKQFKFIDCLHFILSGNETIYRYYTRNGYIDFKHFDQILGEYYFNKSINKKVDFRFIIKNEEEIIYHKEYRGRKHTLPHF